MTSNPEPIIGRNFDKTPSYFDVVGIGALNVDYIATSSNLERIGAKSSAELGDRFEYGIETFAKKEDVDETVTKFHHVFDIFLGGSSFNAIKTIRALSPRPKIGYVGVTNYHHVDSRQFVEYFELNGIDHKFVFDFAGEPPGICLSFIDRGERTLQVSPGVNLQFANIAQKYREDLKIYLKKAKIIHITSFLDEESPIILAEIIEKTKDENPWVKISFDPGYEWCNSQNRGVRRIFQLSDFLFVNEREFYDLGERAIASDEGFKENARTIFEKFVNIDTLIVLKRTNNITVFHNNFGKVFQRKYKHHTVNEDEIEDSTGAGDIVAGSIIFGYLLSGFNVSHSVELAIDLVRDKLRSKGTNSEQSMPAIFERYVARTFDNSSTESDPKEVVEFERETQNNPSGLRIRDLVANMTVPQFWKLLTSLGGLVVIVATIAFAAGKLTGSGG